MIVPEYVPGRWTAVVTGGTLALVGPHTRPATVRALWDEAPARSGLVGLLGVLVREGFDGLPPFALAALEGDRVHVALRGDVEVVVDRADGALVLRAGDVSTWTEQVVDGALGVSVRVATAVPDAVALPVVEGVVRAEAVTVGLVAEPDAEPDAERASVGTAARQASSVVAEPAHRPEIEVTLADLVADTALPDGDEPVPAAAEAPDPLDLGTAWPVTTDGPVLPAEAVVPTEAVLPTEAALPPSPAPAPAAEAIGEPTEQPAEELTGSVDPWAFPTAEPTHVQPVADAEVVQAAEALLRDVPSSSPEDHDGLTIMSSDLAAIRDQLPSWAAETAPGSYPQVPVVTGAVPVAEPAHRLVLSTGLVVSLDRAVLLGRAPQVSRVANRELPRLVTVPSPQQDISRTHAEVRVEGGDVLVTDLGSTNGVQVQTDGTPARRLHPGEPTRVGEGETVDLGDGVTFTVERGS